VTLSADEARELAATPESHAAGVEAAEGGD
jgi:hypothetical protein